MHVLEENEKCLPDELEFAIRETIVGLEKENQGYTACQGAMSHPGKERTSTAEYSDPLAEGAEML